MKKLLPLLILSSLLLSQDVLTTVNDKKYSGELVEIQEDYIVFIREGATVPQKLPKTVIANIRKNDGTILEYSGIIISPIQNKPQQKREGEKGGLTDEEFLEAFGLTETANIFTDKETKTLMIARWRNDVLKRLRGELEEAKASDISLDNIDLINTGGSPNEETQEIKIIRNPNTQLSEEYSNILVLIEVNGLSNESNLYRVLENKAFSTAEDIWMENGFNVIDRSFLEVLLNEQGLATSGLTDVQKYEMGSLVGADALFSIQVNITQIPFIDKYKIMYKSNSSINMRLVDISNGITLIKAHSQISYEGDTTGKNCGVDCLLSTMLKKD